MIPHRRHYFLFKKIKDRLNVTRFKQFVWLMFSLMFFFQQRLYSSDPNKHACMPYFILTNIQPCTLLFGPARLFIFLDIVRISVKYSGLFWIFFAKTRLSFGNFFLLGSVVISLCFLWIKLPVFTLHSFYILSETRMLRNHYFSFFLSDQSLLSSPRSVDSWRRLSIGFIPFIEFSHLGVNNSWLI